MNHPRFSAKIKQAYKESLTGESKTLDEVIAKIKEKLADV